MPLGPPAWLRSLSEFAGRDTQRAGGFTGSGLSATKHPAHSREQIASNWERLLLAFGDDYDVSHRNSFEFFGEQRTVYMIPDDAA